jgi:hypothetical protein
MNLNTLLFATVITIGVVIFDHGQGTPVHGAAIESVKRNAELEKVMNFFRTASAAHQAGQLNVNKVDPIPPVPSFPGQMFSEVVVEIADFATGDIVTAEGQLYYDALHARSRVDLSYNSNGNEFPLSIQYHDYESTKYEIYSLGPTEQQQNMMFPWPILCYYIEEFPAINMPSSWNYLGPYFFGTHAGDAYYFLDTNTNRTHYWLQDIYNTYPLVNAWEGRTTEEVVGYFPVTMKIGPIDLEEFEIPERMGCQPASAASAEQLKHHPAANVPQPQFALQRFGGVFTQII